MIGQRWGVTDAETQLVYGCDAVVPAPVLELWRGVSIAAPSPAVWPWVRMLRRGPYSYDWVDNLGRTSPRVLEDLPEPAPGDRAMRVARVLAVRPGVELTVELGACGGPLGRTVMSYLLAPAGEESRLLLKVVVEPGGPLTRLLTATLPVGDLVMARKQLLTLRDLAEAAT